MDDEVAEVGRLQLADDALDGAIGATKARYFGTAISAAFMILQKGGEGGLMRNGKPSIMDSMTYEILD